MQEIDFYQLLLNLPNLAITGASSDDRRITLFCRITTPEAPCPHCGKSTQQVNQHTTRQVRDLDISGRQVWLHVELRQFVCQDCNRYFTETLSFADSSKSYTHRQAKWIFECCRYQSFTAVGALLDINPKTVERIFYRLSQKTIDLPARYQAVRRLGIDEISHRKGKQNYCCVLTDLDSGQILDILPDRSKESIRAHFQRIGPDFCHQIESVCFDMWSAYHHVSRELFPSAVLVVDRFHVVKLLNDVLDKFRRKLRRQSPNTTEFKSIKWALWKVNPTDQEREQIEMACQKKPELASLVTLRNTFSHAFETAKTPEELEDLLRNWIKQANPISQLDAFVHTLRRWLTPIKNFAFERLTNAATEGLNNLIRYVKRMSFGIPNFDHMRSRVLACSIT
jgi:transposase